MKLLIIDHYYPAFLKSFYGKNPRFKNASVGEQKKRLMEEMFGTADFYSQALRQNGCPARDVIINNEYLQKKWAQENYISGVGTLQKTTDFLLSRTPFLGERLAKNWELKILYEQIKKFKPDILYNQNLGYLDSGFLFSVKPMVKLIVGQIAAPIPPLRNFKAYDLIITSFPHFVSKFRKMGISSEYLPLCFEPKVLEKIRKPKRLYNVTFIGGFGRAHDRGRQMLAEVAKKVKLDVWGYGKEKLEPSSPLLRAYHGEAWGKEMYKLMLQSKITLNRHIDVAENYANNMRLFEATGCGAMLITDMKDNLGDLFVVGKEVVAYKNTEDLIAKIKYYLSHEKEREMIGLAGQKRTVKDHTYIVRMKQLVKIIEKHLQK